MNEQPIRFRSSLVTRAADGSAVIVLFDGASERHELVGLYSCSEAAALGLIAGFIEFLRGDGDFDE